VTELVRVEDVLPPESPSIQSFSQAQNLWEREKKQLENESSSPLSQRGVRGDFFLSPSATERNYILEWQWEPFVPGQKEKSLV
jgi:hypothetical protein